MPHEPYLYGQSISKLHEEREAVRTLGKPTCGAGGDTQILTKVPKAGSAHGVNLGTGTLIPGPWQVELRSRKVGLPGTRCLYC